MIIINKKKNGIINTDELTKIFVNSERAAIYYVVDARKEIMEIYDTVNEARTAMMMLCDRVAVARGQGVVFVPTDEEVRLRMREIDRSERTNSSHKSGIRHGGS